MPLSEDQIVRYSRQILLREVGGVGQQKLLEAAVRLRGAGSALQTAAAYLAAGGVGVRPQERTVEPGEEGFLLGAAEVGRPCAAPLRMALSDLSRDALPRRAVEGVLGELPCAFPEPGPWLLLGWEGEDGVVLWRSAQGCASCFEANAAELSNGPSDARSVALGALGALCFERLVLGLGAPPEVGGVRLGQDGSVSPYQPRRCEVHAA